MTRVMTRVAASVARAARIDQIALAHRAPAPRGAA